MTSHGQLYDPCLTQDIDDFVAFPDVLGGDDYAEEDTFRVSEGFTEHLPQQEWTAGPSYFESEKDEPNLVDTSLEEEERVDLSFSSPERNSVFPRVGTTQDTSWSPERLFPLTDASPTKADFASTSSQNTVPVYEATSPLDAAAIVVEERLSILFDGVSSEPACRVIGRIHVCDMC
jgi:hypothetical protein